MKMGSLLKKIIPSPLGIALFIGHFVFISVLVLQTTGLLQSLELLAYDLMLRTHSLEMPSVKKSVNDRIVMILANDQDQRQWGWPLSDNLLTQLFEKVLAGQPNVIGLDIYRDLPVPIEGSEGYQHLTRLFQNQSNIIGIYKYRDNKGANVDPSPVLKEKDQAGFNDIPADSGGIIRRGLLYMADNQGNVLEFFGLKLALHYLAQKGIEPQADPHNPSALLLGKVSLVPLDPDFGGYVNGDTGGFQIMMNYPGAPKGFQILSFTQVLTEEFNLKILTDKIVIIGVNAEATPDFVYTPFGNWLEGEQRVPGAMVHAYHISQLLQMALGELKPIQSWTQIPEILWVWLASVLSALIGLWAHSLWRFILTMLSGIFLLSFGSYLAFSYYNTWIIVAAPILGWSASFLLMLAYLSNQEKQQRAVLMQIFSKHVSKEVAEEIWNKREQYLREGRLVPQRVTATVLFTDLQGFTSVSERMEPQALMDWLNQYMEAMVNVVEKQHGGQVNKFIGDAIMAVFGVPIPSTTSEAIIRDATNAVDCALSMRREIEHLRDIWQSQGLPLIRMRVGIFTGPLVVGSLGGVERQEYTVIGDTVNTASRLESFDKNIDADNVCRILIGESTLQYTSNRFQTERVGEVYLKGKQSQITIYKVI